MKLTAKNLWDLKDKYENARKIRDYRRLIDKIKTAAKYGKLDCEIMFHEFGYLEDNKVINMLEKRGFTIEPVGVEYSSSFKRVSWFV